ncbi:hypothetical protein ACH4UM_37930 [Streptomyces sp. NPDC020801]|uniref:hypothetical protein n=1 Tax=Streptomyces sp. NPDC020801 TaxID=3365093 RepID=UPI00379E1B79
MAYAYRCGTCRTTSPAAPNRRSAEDECNRHRNLVHGGHIPDGEEITSTDDGGQFIRLSTIGLFFAGCAVLALIGFIRAHL